MFYSLGSCCAKVSLSNETDAFVKLKCIELASQTSAVAVPNVRYISKFPTFGLEHIFRVQRFLHRRKVD
jgi:hypothetical protein